MSVVYCPLCKVSYPAGEDHDCVPTEDLIVDVTDAETGEMFSTWATMANRDWSK